MGSIKGGEKNMVDTNERKDREPEIIEEGLIPERRFRLFGGRRTTISLMPLSNIFGDIADAVKLHKTFKQVRRERQARERAQR